MKHFNWPKQTFCLFGFWILKSWDFGFCSVFETDFFFKSQKCSWDGKKVSHPALVSTNAIFEGLPPFSDVDQPAIRTMQTIPMPAHGLQNEAAKRQSPKDENWDWIERPNGMGFFSIWEEGRPGLSLLQRFREQRNRQYLREEKLCPVYCCCGGRPFCLHFGTWC